MALRPGYLSRVHAAQRGDDGSEGFRWAFTRGDRELPPPDPATDIALDIPPSVREWALTAERHPGPARPSARLGPGGTARGHRLPSGRPGPVSQSVLHDRHPAAGAWPGVIPLDKALVLAFSANLASFDYRRVSFFSIHGLPDI